MANDDPDISGEAGGCFGDGRRLREIQRGVIPVLSNRWNPGLDPRPRLLSSRGCGYGGAE